jgi:hypothetical protein
MRHFILGVSAAVFLTAVPSLVDAQSTKSVRGTITELAADAITIQADGKDMKFVIDGKTQVITPGGGTKSRAAEAAGKGVGVMDVLKVGQAVEVRYRDPGMQAASIRTIASVSSPAAAPAATRAQTTSGVVSSISGNALTIKGAAGESTFTIDDTTRVIATGGSTADRKAASEGKKPTLTELVHDGDTVSVTYRDMNGTKHASVVRVTKKK